MLIRKDFQGEIPANKIMGTYTESDTDTYSCNYVNKLYSYEEQQIGVWADGKPLYRRCFKGNTASGTTTVVTTSIGTNNASVKNGGGYVTEKSTGNLQMLVGGYINTNWNCGFYITEGSVGILHASNLGGAPYEVFLEYTKK
jgi:hypothetical protein